MTMVPNRVKLLLTNKRKRNGNGNRDIGIENWEAYVNNLGRKGPGLPNRISSQTEKHLGENAELVTIKNAGHALNVEKPKEMYKNLKSFLIDPITPSMQKNYSNGRMVD
ncbi:Monoacylglycerol lipase ABHD6 [Spatholobus suberectus]|nr:Monoacylglycerol lipase ABHD6 [Spatholobus suberectus]